MGAPEGGVERSTPAAAGRALLLELLGPEVQGAAVAHEAEFNSPDSRGPGGSGLVEARNYRLVVDDRSSGIPNDQSGAATSGRRRVIDGGPRARVGPGIGDRRGNAGDASSLELEVVRRVGDLRLERAQRITAAGITKGREEEQKNEGSRHE